MPYWWAALPPLSMPVTVTPQRLSEPAPRDRRVTSQLSAYKGLSPRWQDWMEVVRACQRLADELLRGTEEAT